MEVNFGGVGNTTKKTYMDFLKPAGMTNAQSIFSKIQIVQGTETVDAVNIAGSVTDSILSTKGSELDDIWTKIENSLYRRKTLRKTSTSTSGDVVTAVGLIYAALEEVDKSDNINYVRSLSSMYGRIKNYVNSRVLGRFEGMDKRTIQRSLDTMDSYMGRVIERFNTRIENQEIGGTPIET